MTFEEVAASLPNGFHDAELQRFEMDLFNESCSSISWCGSVTWMTRNVESSIARLLLTLDNVAFLVIEPPDINYPWLKAGCIRIDAGKGQPRQSSSALPAAPEGTRTTGELNRFLLFSAGNASLEWTGPEVDRT